MANTNLLATQANIASQNAVANAANPGVNPPDYKQANYWRYYRRMGQNVYAAPVLLPLLSDPSQDMSFPTQANLVTMGPPQWNVLDPNFLQLPAPAPTFPALQVPPAATHSTNVFPSGNPSSPPAGSGPFPPNPPFPRTKALL
jgi:hypothetical protein